MKKAGFLRRLAAHFIDNTIIFLIFFPPYALPLNEKLLDLLSLFVAFALIPYHILFWVKYGATPGKMVLRLKVIAEEEKGISFGRAVLRYFGYILCNITLGFGYLFIIFDKDKQRLHDKIAKTYVIVHSRGTLNE
jgi:uncharacterized RDD family membrane protein YckC